MRYDLYLPESVPRDDMSVRVLEWRLQGASIFSNDQYVLFMRYVEDSSRKTVCEYWGYRLVGDTWEFVDDSDADIADSWGDSCTEACPFYSKCIESG